MFDDFDDNENESDDFFDSHEIEESLVKFESLKNNETVFFSEEEIEDLSFHFLICGDYKNQIIILDYGLNLYPNKVNFLIDKAGVLSYNSEYNEALKVVRIAKDIEPYNAYILKTEGEILTFMELHDEAHDCFDHAMKLAEMEDEAFKVDLCLNFAQVLNFKNQHKKAIEVIENSLKEYPENELLIYHLGNSFEAKGDFESAIQVFNDKIDQFPFSEHYWNQLGKFYDLNKQMELALKSFEYATLINQDSKISFLNLGNVYENLSQYDKAIKSYLNAFQNNNDEFPYLCIARCCLALENSDLCRYYLNKAKSLEEIYPEYNYLFGYSYIHDQEPKKALPYFKKVFTEDNEDFASLKGILTCYSELEEYDNVKNLYLQTLKDDANLLYQNWKETAGILYICEFDDEFNEFLLKKEVSLKNEIPIQGLLHCIKYDQEPSQSNKESIISHLLIDKEDILESIKIFCAQLLEEQSFQKVIEYYKNQHE